MDPATTSDDGPEICFFDLETTVPQRRGQGRAILEFGAILVCPKRLVELESYSSLVRPDDLSSVSPAPERRNAITRNDVVSAPPFSQIAGKVHDLLNGRVWAGHNIVTFDCVRIREAFENIGRPVPEPKGIIDSLALLTRSFGRRAGNMKMATLAKYFGIGVQTHRSLDDVRMNLEVVKYCATVLFLESSLPDILTADAEFLEPNEVCLSSISASLISYYSGTHGIRLLHENIALKLFCPCLRVRFGVDGKFLDQAGRPRLSFVVDASPGLCEILDACDNAAKTIFEECRSSSEWKPIVGRNYQNINNPTVRLNIPTVVNEDVARYATEIHQKDSSGTEQKLVFSKCDVAELGNLFRAGIFVDAFFSLDTYDYQWGAGIRLVAKKLVIHSD